MSEPPPAAAASDGLSDVSSRSFLTGTAFFLLGGATPIVHVLLRVLGP